MPGHNDRKARTKNSYLDTAEEKEERFDRALNGPNRSRNQTARNERQRQRNRNR